MFLEIDKQLIDSKQRIINIVDTLEFVEISIFKLDDTIKDLPLQFDELQYSGVYLLEIKNNNEFKTFPNWVESFLQLWLGENNIYEKKFTPNLKKKRINAHEVLNDWIPLYIGKSKNIKKRVLEHIYKDLDKTTFALKLASRENLFENVFKLSAIKIDVKNYDIIVPIIESELRNKINPIIGRQ